VTSGSDECPCHKVCQPGRVFHPFSVEVDETGLALTNGFDRHVKAQDIHILSACEGDDNYTAGCSGASRLQDRRSSSYRVR